MKDLKNELRIGNWVAFKKKQLNGFNATTVTASSFEMNYINNTFKPERLSEFWFDHFKFKKIPLEEEYYFDGFYYEKEISSDKYCDLSIISGDKNGFIEAGLFPYEETITVKYVHELQNLYFSLTGKELS